MLRSLARSLLLQAQDGSSRLLGVCSTSGRTAAVSGRTWASQQLCRVQVRELAPAALRLQASRPLRPAQSSRIMRAQARACAQRRTAAGPHPAPLNPTHCALFCRRDSRVDMPAQTHINWDLGRAGTAAPRRRRAATAAASQAADAAAPAAPVVNSAAAPPMPGSWVAATACTRERLPFCSGSYTRPCAGPAAAARQRRR